MVLDGRFNRLALLAGERDRLGPCQGLETGCRIAYPRSSHTVGAVIVVKVQLLLIPSSYLVLRPFMAHLAVKDATQTLPTIPQPPCLMQPAPQQCQPANWLQLAIPHMVLRNERGII